MVVSQTLKKILDRATMENFSESIPNSMSNSVIAMNTCKLTSKEAIVIT